MVFGQVSTESMNIALEHAFSAGASAWPEGFSGMSKVVDDAMTTTDVVFSDGTTVTFQPGATVQLSLADWLKVADANISESVTIDSRCGPALSPRKPQSSFPRHVGRTSVSHLFKHVDPSLCGRWDRPRQPQHERRARHGR